MGNHLYSPYACIPTADFLVCFIGPTEKVIKVYVVGLRSIDFTGSRAQKWDTLYSAIGINFQTISMA